MISSKFKTPATKKTNTSHVWVKLLRSCFFGEQVIRCTLRTTAWDQATFGLHCFQTILTHCSQISYRGGQRLTKLRCTYQFKSPIKAKDSTPIFAIKLHVLRLCYPTVCFSHRLSIAACLESPGGSRNYLAPLHWPISH